MSFNNKLMVFYPNYLNYHLTSIDTALNYDPSAEPTITGESSTSSGGETDTGAQGKPAYDLTDNKITSVVTIDTNSQTTSPQIDFDTTTNVTADTVIIANHNFSTASAAADLYIKSGAGPTTATVNSAYTGARAITGEWQASTQPTITSNLIKTGLDGTDGILIANINSITSNNLIIDIDADGASFSADITIGEVIFSKKWTAPHAPETNGWQDVDEYGNMISKSSGGKNFGTFLYGNRKRITLSWKNLSTAVYTTLKTVERITKGSTYPMFVDLGESTNSYLRFMRFVNPIVGTPIAGGTAWNVTVTLEEE